MLLYDQDQGCLTVCFWLAPPLLYSNFLYFTHCPSLLLLSFFLYFFVSFYILLYYKFTITFADCLYIDKYFDFNNAIHVMFFFSFLFF